MRSIVTLHVGQAGIQAGESAWDLIRREHGSNINGLPVANDAFNGDWGSMFDETNAGRVVPRAVFADLEPGLCDRIRRGSLGHLFNPEQMISGRADASNCFARGRSRAARTLVEVTSNQLRRQSERCDSLQGVVMVQAMGGGTGSGLGASLLEHIGQDYRKATRLQLALYPSTHITSAALEPYNAVLGLHATMDAADISILVDNESLYDLASRNLHVDRPSYGHVNRLLAQVVSSMTVSARFQGVLNLSMSDIKTNLVPYPRLHFPVVSFAPVVSPQVALNERLSVADITSTAFEASNHMIRCDPSRGTYLACGLIYRGDATPKDVNAIVSQIKTRPTARFVDWCPTGFKIGINASPPSPAADDDDLARLQRSVLAVSNTTAIGDALSRVDIGFDRLFARRAFVHWFAGDGVDEAEFRAAREDLADLENDYKQAAEH